MAQAITATSTAAATTPKMRRLRRASRACGSAAWVPGGTKSGVIGGLWSSILAPSRNRSTCRKRSRRRQKNGGGADHPATPRGETDKLTQVLALWATQRAKKCKEICVSGQPEPCSGQNVYRSASWIRRTARASQNRH